MTDNYIRVSLSSWPYRKVATTPTGQTWKQDMVDAVRGHINGEPIYVEFTDEPRRTGSIGRLEITNIQDLLNGHHKVHPNYWRRDESATWKIQPLDPALIKPETFDNVTIQGKIKWDGRTNACQFTTWGLNWLKGRTKEEGTKWVFETPKVPKVIPYDKLKQEIKVGDFISYILYHFDNSNNAAGLYYGKVTKIETDGTVHAKNIKLKEDDHVEEKRIKDNSLIVIMSKNIMDKLMLARLSIL